MEIGEIVGYVALSHGRLSLMHVSVLGSPQSFTKVGQKLQFWAKFSTRFSNGGLLFHVREEYGKSKTITFISDYI